MQAGPSAKKGNIQTSASIKRKVSFLASRVDAGLCPGWHRWSTQAVSCGLTSRHRLRNARPAVFRARQQHGDRFVFYFIFPGSMPRVTDGEGEGRAMGVSFTASLSPPPLLGSPSTFSRLYPVLV